MTIFDQPGMIDLFAAVVLVPLFWMVLNGFQPRSSARELGLKDPVVFRQARGWGILMALAALGVPVAIGAYLWRPEDWLFYALMGGFFGLIGVLGLIEHFRTRVVIQDGRVFHRGLLRQYDFPLSEVKSAWIAGHIIVVDLGIPRRKVISATIGNRQALLSILNRRSVV